MKVGIIGAGNMGGAIALGLAMSGAVKRNDITLCAPHDATLERYRQWSPDMVLSTDNVAAVDGSDVIILAVKPWVLDGVMKEIAGRIDFRNQMLVSVVAGVSLETLASYAGDVADEAAVFRVIPNLAIAQGQSMTFVSSRGADDRQVAALREMFDKVGETMIVDESAMGACTALSSCGIAYVMRYIRASCEGAVELGLYPDQAKTIMLRTMEGAVALLRTSNSHPEAEIDRVTTPGGLTIKGLNTMEANGFSHAVIEGLRASIK